MISVNPRSMVVFGIVGIILCGFVVYGYFQSRTIITGPILTISSPTNGQTIASTSPEILIRGTARNISFLTIGGVQTFTDEQGAFARELLLPEGYSIITIEAQDKFNRSVKKELQLFVK